MRCSAGPSRRASRSALPRDLRAARGQRGGLDLAFAYEALARASRVAGDEDDARRFERRGRELVDQIADPEEKDIALKDYATR